MIQGTLVEGIDPLEIITSDSLFKEKEPCVEFSTVSP
jgi:hypothetical protein